MCRILFLEHQLNSWTLINSLVFINNFVRKYHQNLPCIWNTYHFGLINLRKYFSNRAFTENRLWIELLKETRNAWPTQQVSSVSSSLEQSLFFTTSFWNNNDKNTKFNEYNPTVNQKYHKYFYVHRTPVTEGSHFRARK